VTEATLATMIGVVGSALQLVGSVLTLWGLISATKGTWSRLRTLVGALWHSRASKIAGDLSVLNKDDRGRALQGLAVLALGYLLALGSQIWSMTL
jgi:hypothetical protein